MWAGRLVLGCLAVFWCLVLLVGAANSGYSQTRDYVSTLAARGSDYGWLGVLAICAAALAMIATAALLRALSRLAAALTGIAGIGFLVVAVTRLSCPKALPGVDSAGVSRSLASARSRIRLRPRSRLCSSSLRWRGRGSSSIVAGAHAPAW